MCVTEGQLAHWVCVFEWSVTSGLDETLRHTNKRFTSYVIICGMAMTQTACSICLLKSHLSELTAHFNLCKISFSWLWTHFWSVNEKLQQKKLKIHFQCHFSFTKKRTKMAFIGREASYLSDRTSSIWYGRFLVHTCARDALCDAATLNSWHGACERELTSFSIYSWY